LGFVCGGFSQQESSGVFLSMGHNGFSPPMKPYSRCQAGSPSLEIWDRWKDGARVFEEMKNVKEQDGREKRGIKGNWHPFLSETSMENR